MTHSMRFGYAALLLSFAVMPLRGQTPEAPSAATLGAPILPDAPVPEASESTLPGRSYVVPVLPAPLSVAPVARASAFQPVLAASDSGITPYSESLSGGHTNGVVVGASYYMLRPFVENNTAYRTTNGLGGATPQTSSTDFGWEMRPAFAIWGGYNFEDGFGIRTRWFHMDTTSNTLNATLGSPAAVTTNITASPNLPGLPLPLGASVFGSPGLLLNSGLGQDTLTFSSTLRIDAVDAEATWNWNLGNWRFIVGAGGRYVHMDQSYQAHLSNKLGDGVTSENQSLSFGHTFDGGGPIIDLQGNWKIGCTNFSVYGLGRGSLLVGRSTQLTSYSQNVNDPRGLTNGGAFPVVTSINPTVVNYTDNVMPILEFELGLEYGHDLGRTHIFFRSAVVNQTYFEHGNATRTDGNLSLFGVQFSTGINY